MTPEQTDLARRAVACRGFRWVPGMLAIEWATPGMGLARRPMRVDDGWPDVGVYLPDLTDPATLGCLLALVRDAWGDPSAYLCDFDGYDSVEWGVVSHAWDAKRQAEGPKAWFSCLLGDADTEAGALVRALEVAP